MSKEKNLTMVRTINGHTGPCVDPQTHLYCREEIREPIDLHDPTIRYIKYSPVEGLFGPAIDRLYEFEKLGMEPEEIERLQQRHNYFRARSRVLEDSNYELERSLKNIKADFENVVNGTAYQKIQEENEELKKDVEYWKSSCESRVNKNQRLEENIVGLQGYIKALEEDCEFFKGERNDAFEEVKRLKVEIDEREKVAGASYGEIGRLSELVRLQRNAIDGYVESNADLRKKLNRSVESNRALQKQIEFYQDKLERIDCILTEDDE